MPTANWRPVSFEQVRNIEGFWERRFEATRTSTARVCLDQCESTGRLANFRRAAGLESGGYQGRFYNDSDVYKVLEGIAYLLCSARETGLEEEADRIINTICAAQWDDGYINTYYTLTDPSRRWTDMAMHEDYCIGHMVEGAIAYFQATGKDKWLHASIRAAEHMMDTFGEGKRHWVIGHQEPELAFVRLWRLTGEQRFLDFAQWMINERGHGHLVSEHFEYRGFGREYCQDDVPAQDLHRVTGHAVRAMYYYSAMADIAMIQEDTHLRQALHRLWDNVVPANLYITGGIGQTAEHEGFTRDFHLPNLTAYCETCASIGMAMWNHRMNLMEGDAKYADLVETELFNGALAGVSLRGDRFFYENPLSSVGVHHRLPWHDCSCCPTNILRFIPSIGGYAYAVDGATLVLNQYLSNRASIMVNGVPTQIHVQTEYPWEGLIRIHVEEPGACTGLRLRIPGWCAEWELNGERLPTHRGYLHCPLPPDGVLVLKLHMPVREMKQDDRVLETRGRKAIARGPLIYCAEETDNPGWVPEYFPADFPLPRGTPRVARHFGFTEEVHALHIENAVLVPYYAWDNREKGAMTVWMKEAALPEKPLLSPHAAGCSESTAP